MVSCHLDAPAGSHFLATSGVAGNIGRLQLAARGCVGDAYKESRNQNKGGILSKMKPAFPVNILVLRQLATSDPTRKKRLPRRLAPK